MSVNKIKDYKIVNGEKIKKTKEEFNRETCGGKKIWYYQGYYTTLLGERKKYKSKKFATQREAEEQERIFLAKQNISTSGITIYNLYYSFFFLDNKITNKDSSLYTKESRTRIYILPFFYNKKTSKYLDIVLIDTDKIKQWKTWLDDTELSLRTKNSIYSTFSSLMRYAVEKFNLKLNPFNLTENFKEKNDKIIEDEEIRYITNDEYQLFINEVDKEFKPIFHFLYETGCRKGEMASLKWKNIDFERNQVKINTTFSRTKKGSLTISSTKNNKIKYIDISNQLTIELRELYNKMCRLDGFNNEWFVFGGINHISYSTLTRRKNQAFDRLEKKGIFINRITIHEFRHSSASFMISNKISIEVIAYRLGDTPETIRRVYARLFPNTQNEAKNLFEKL